MTADSSPAEQQPFLRVIRGDATPEEVAAVVAVLAALRAPAAAPARVRPEWNAPHRVVRRTLPHGPGGWRSSGLPR
ncbi:acyl-CoA carboxylase epsilon subunit [Nocardioides sp. URHA0032]|jgi:Acyl-CoA carboxylase epsilon subunit|uniref:acyl-CoA carboxylase epsilon subunit n=1 Tax=Nocardioides sp. URHA0032 TaxID=1380388 RepID=UPI00048B51FD|nr:acyl-CoA carboxylase epsilon subunit [Nocardioides sp. URHA0032]